MKKINILNIENPEVPKSAITINNRYRVHLGNEKVFDYKAKHKAEHLLSEVNRILNDCAQELNLIFADIFYEYRRLWFELHIRLEDEFMNLSKIFEIVMARSEMPNGNYFTFVNMSKICLSMKYILDMLVEHCLKKKNYPCINAINTLIVRISIIEIRLEDAGNQGAL